MALNKIQPNIATEPKEKSRQYYETNKKRKRQYNETHKEQINERSRQYYETHKEQIKERNRQYHKSYITEQLFSRHHIEMFAQYEPKIVNGYLMVRCKKCGEYFNPTIAEFYSYVNHCVNMYCSTSCKEECPVYNSTEESFKRKVLYGDEYDDYINRDDVFLPEIKELVKERDDYRCVRCGKEGTKESPLHVHHIVPIKDNYMLGSDMDNLVTLCEECHRYVHSQNGCTYSELANKQTPCIVHKEKTLSVDDFV